MVANQQDPGIQQFLFGKPEQTLLLYSHFLEIFREIGEITVQPTKTMIGISNDRKRIAWITQLGKNFIHVVLPFKRLYEDNLCFQKIAQVPGSSTQFNHHFRMYLPEDLNEEVKEFLKLAYFEEESA